MNTEHIASRIVSRILPIVLGAALAGCAGSTGASSREPYSSVLSTPRNDGARVGLAPVVAQQTTEPRAGRRH